MKKGNPNIGIANVTACSWRGCFVAYFGRPEHGGWRHFSVDDFNRPEVQPVVDLSGEADGKVILCPSHYWALADYLDKRRRQYRRLLRKPRAPQRKVRDGQLPLLGEESR